MNLPRKSMDILKWETCRYFPFILTTETKDLERNIHTRGINLGKINSIITTGLQEVNPLVVGTTECTVQNVLGELIICSEISSSHGDEYEGYSLPGYTAV
jgi:hypothetical protein